MIFEIKAQNNADVMLKGSRTFQSMMFGAAVFFFFFFRIFSFILFGATLQLWQLCRTYWKEQQREVERVVLDPSPSYCRRRLEHSTVYPVTNKKYILKIMCSPGQVLHNINKLYYQWSSVDITHNSQ